MKKNQLLVEFFMLNTKSDILNNLSEKISNDKEGNLNISMIALECLKKSNVSGSTDDIMNEYTKIYNFLSDNIKQNNSKKVNFKTVFDDYIICLEDGKKMKMLKRHLRTKYNMSFEEYKEKWGLPYDYPYVCKNYSNIRANIAGKIKSKK